MDQPPWPPRSAPSGAKQEQQRQRQLPLGISLPLRWLLVRHGAIVAESASQRAGLGIRLDVLGHLFVAEWELIERPLPEDVP